nr:MAG TPA: protein of unknown function (DUF3504) [Caudoviricetes sp.]
MVEGEHRKVPLLLIRKVWIYNIYYFCVIMK